METRITFKSDTFEIEGLFCAQSQKAGAVVTHPHPLYGGDMYNPVVERAIAVYQKRGYSTLRFNFRGVGQSQGAYDEGRGEKTDILGALAFLAGKGISRFDLAGYSFGAWVNGHLSTGDASISDMIMISPPIGMIDINPPDPLQCLGLVITGENDDIAPAALIREKLPAWNSAAELVVIPGADHFLSGYLQDLENGLMRYIKPLGEPYEDR